MVSSKIDSSLLQRATVALLKYHESTSSQKNLLEDDEGIIVQFGLLRVPVYPSGKTNVKPIRLDIPHPIQGDDEDPEICLIVKQDDKTWVEEMVEEKYPEYLGCVKLVVGLQDLRTKYGLYKQRRELLNGYDMFLADDRILPMLRSALGGKFITRKKFPVPVRLTKSNPDALPLAVKRSISSTYMYQVRGNSLSVRAGNTGMSAEYLVENFEAIVEEVANRIPRGWGNILNISIKTGHSVSLPFYNRRPDELAELEKLVQENNKDEPSPSKEGKKRKVDGGDGDDHNETSSKKVAAKSPLLRAMKKQKKTENSTEGKKATGTKTLSKKKDLDESHKESEKESIPATPSLKAMKKAKGKGIDASSPSAAKHSSKIEGETNVSGSLIKTEEKREIKTPLQKNKTELKSSKASTSKKSKTQEIVATKAQTTRNGRSDEAASSETVRRFEKSNKFKGAKSGYVFKAGPKGTGYYIDEPPVVNKAAMAAILRIGNGRGTPRSSAKKRKGRR
jgi:ribosome biogenesis protein UTP30